MAIKISKEVFKFISEMSFNSVEIETTKHGVIVYVYCNKKLYAVRGVNGDCLLFDAEKGFYKEIKGIK